MDRPFLVIQSDEGSVVVNLLQVVQTGDMTDDRLVLHMSNGSFININGADGVKQVLRVLSDYSLAMSGRPMRLREGSGFEPEGAEKPTGIGS